MSESRRSFRTRMAWAGAAAGLFLVLTGDRGTHGAVPPIDPLEILKLQVKPNVLIILDSSGSMEEPFTNTPACCPSIGGDFAFSKMAKAKVALNKVLKSNQGVVNFGFATYAALNSNKTIMSADGAMRYVTNQATANLWTGGTAAPDGTTDYFRAPAAPYTGANGADVFRSFGNFANLLDLNQAAACTVEPCQRFLNTRLVRNNVKYTWNTTGAKPATAADALLTATTAIDCSLAANRAPIALFPDDPDANGDLLSDNVRACFQMQDSAGNVTTFWWSTANWNSGVSNCSGAALLSAVAACGTDNVPSILQRVKPELPLDGTCGTPVGVPCGATPNVAIEGTNPAGLNANTWEGVIAAGNTPLGGALSYVDTNFSTVFPSAIGGVQQNFVILVTDGIETCSGNPVLAAGALYARNPRVYTFVIGLAISTTTLDQIARAGSGGNRDAIPAGSVADLEAALNSVIDTAVSTGAFSASPFVVSTVFELVRDLPSTTEHESPYDPDTRYNQRVNILYQSQFGLPGWDGHLYAFQNDGSFLAVPDATNVTGNYDAGETLFEQVSEVLVGATRGSGRPPNRFTFFELHNGATVDSIQNEDPAANGAVLRRRVFTSNGNGSFPRTGLADDQFDSSTTAGRNVVALWPPNQTGLSSGIAPIDPAVGTVGPLDNALGIGPGSATVLTYLNLQTKLGACVGSADADSGAVPAGCNLASPVLALDTARKEARQILLAYAAGARLDKGSTSDAKPRRATDGSNAGELIYRDRGWLLLDSTNATPGVMGPPGLGADPPAHVSEWVLMRDGRRNAAGLGIAEIDKGFGLTNPDRDDPSPAGNTTLKPVMTVLYSAHNDGLHAFSALSSEELWNFVPYDQLGKLMSIVNPGQARVPHIYMMATSVRFTDVFLRDVNGFTLPSPSGTPVTYSGRWRRVLFLGRGPGGKFYTALDVTAPGQFTRPYLATNPPFVMWSRGNPDSADPTNYAKMGYTWSIPAIGDVSAQSDFRVFTGSGYGDTPTEGTTFYQLDPASGDVLLANDVGDGTGTYIPDNALVAPPAAYNTFSLDLPYTLVRSTPNAVTRVYIPDLHGRIWKFNTSSGGLFYDAGPTQPFGNGPALLKLGGQPNIFVESGNDNRIAADSARPFKMFGIADPGTDAWVPNEGSLLFAIPFPAAVAGNPSTIQFRGTSRPASGYTADAKGVVFFVGTRFNTATADCVSSFDTVVFGVEPDASAGAGYSAGYDFNGDGTREISHVIQGQRAGNITIAGDSVNLSMGGTLSASPPPGGGAGQTFPGPSHTPPPASPTPPAVPVTKVTTTSPVCRF